MKSKWQHNPNWNGKFSWLNTSFLLLTPLLSAALIPIYLYYEGFHWSYLLIFTIMTTLTGFGITAGYHRLFAHQTHEAHWALRLYYLIFGAACFQNSAYKWSSDHRYHHRFQDKEGDPYSIKKGFFHAHMGWVFYSDPEGRSYENAKDLYDDKLVNWQHRWYMTIAVSAGFILPTLLGWLIADRPFAGFLFGGLFRVVFVHHGTFFINSLAHYVGSRPYSQKITARDNWWLAFFTNGEGFHNFHHAFANDYRNGVRWYHWDPSKWWILATHYLGLANNLQRTPDAQILRARLESSYEQFCANWNRETPTHLETAKASLEAKLQEFQAKLREFQAWKESRAIEAEWDKKVRARWWQHRLKKERRALEIAISEYRYQLKVTLRTA
jgi:stearoyl-CoA desaturase (delta-9 desaturase)